MIMKTIREAYVKKYSYAEVFDALNGRTPPVLIITKTCNMCICWARFCVRFQKIIPLTVVVELIIISLFFVNSIGTRLGLSAVEWW